MSLQQGVARAGLARSSPKEPQPLWGLEALTAQSHTQLMGTGIATIIYNEYEGLFFIFDAGEDLWHAYNLIREGDRVTATTFRKVMRDTGTGGDSERVKLTLTIQVEGVEYDAEGTCE